MASLSCRIVTAALWLSRRKRTYRSPASLRRRVEQQLLRPGSSQPPRVISLLVHLTVTTRHGWRCYELTPRQRRLAPAQVLYLHGGAYVFQISFFHWLAAARIVAGAGVGLVLPIYPLAPLSTAVDTVATATAIAADLTEARGERELTVMGDSAGGGLALAVAQELRDQHRASLRQLVLISPWLDVSMTDPAIAALDRYDAMLHGPGCAEAGRIYAGALEVHDSRVSPLHGDLMGLPTIAVFSGTHDILHPDAKRLVNLAADAQLPIDLHVLSDGQHVYPLLPMREGTAALRQIVALLTPPRC